MQKKANGHSPKLEIVQEDPTQEPSVEELMDTVNLLVMIEGVPEDPDEPRDEESSDAPVMIFVKPGETKAN